MLTHNVRIVQFACTSTCIPTKHLAIDRALITGFTLPPIDGQHRTAVNFVAEIQSEDQTITLENATARYRNVVVQAIDSSTLDGHVSAVGSTTSKPIVATTAAYVWSMQVTRRTGRTGYMLVPGRASSSDLAALVASGTALDDLRAWQNEPTMHPRSGDLSVAAGTSGPRMTLTFTGLMLVQPVEPFERLQSHMFRWGEHADGLAITVR